MVGIFPFEPVSGASVGMLLSHFSGVLQEQSIREIEFSGVDLLEGEMYTMLGPFFQNNHNLTSITISHCVWGDEFI